MTDFAALLKQYAGSSEPILPALNPVAPPPVPAVVDVKKENLLGTAEAKKETLGGAKGAYDAIASRRTGYGAATLSPLQTDMANLSAADLIAKYGYEQGKAMIDASANASKEVGADVTATRDAGQFVGDAAIDVTTGLVGGLGAIGALGLGVVNADAGVKASELLNQATQWGQTKQSDSLNARRRYSAAQNDLADKDSTAVFNASDKGLTDNLAKIGRDVLDSVAIGASDAQTLASGVGQGVGSMLAIGPMTKAITGAGKLAAGSAIGTKAAAAINASAATGSVPALAALAAGTLAKSAPTALAIGAQTGGGAYTATVADALETLKNRTDLTEDQKMQMANDAGLKAAAIAGPAGVAAGSLVAKFEANPFAKVGVRTALQNTAKETLEEGIQSGASGVAQNIGIQSSVDPTRELNKEVGKQIGEGALYGAGTAGAINIPAVGRGAVSGTAAVAAKGLDAILTRADRLIGKVDAASPVSDQRVNQAVNELGAGAPEAVTRMNAAAETEADPVVKAAINKFAEQLSTFNTYDPASIDPASPDVVKTALAGVTDKPTAIQSLAKVIAETKTDPLDRMVAAATMLDMLTSFENLQNSNNDALDALPSDHPAQVILAQYGKAAQSLGQSPAISKAIQEVIALSQKESGPVVTDENITTPEGLKAVQATAAIAQVAPQNSNVESLNVILKQAAAGKIQLTPRQLSGMKAAAALMNAAIAADAKAAANGLTELSRVGTEIQTETGAKGLSALDHGSRIRAAYDAGDYATGKAQLEDFMLFAQHMQNKVGAVNAAFASGVAGTDGAQKYQSLGQKRKFSLSSKALGVTPSSAGSIRFAQSVALEAERLGGIVNGLVDAFPELGVEKMGLVSLVPELSGVADTVANEFASGVRSMPAQAAQNVAPAVAPVVTPEATPAPVEPVVAAPAKAEPVSKLSDDSLKAELDAVMGVPGYQTTERFKQLDAEMNIREDRAAKELADQEAADIAEEAAFEASKKAALDAAKEAESKRQAKATKPMIIAPDTGARTGFDSMKYSELSAVLEDLQNNPEPTAQNESDIAEIQQILTDRVEADRAKREAAQPKAVKAEPVAEPVVSDTGNVFDGLVFQSRFGTAFQYVKTAASRLVGLEKPLRDVYEALASTEALKAFTGVDQSSTLASDVATAYQSYLRLGNKLKADMRDSLAEFIKTKKVAQAFADASKSDPTTWLNGKPMNITREVDGTYQYDENLLDGAVLAGLQWRITAMDRSSIVDERDAASILSLTEEQVGPYLPLLKNSMGHVEAIRAIAAMLPKYWGVQSKSTESDSYAEGIPLSVAAEVFAAMVERGVIEETVINVPINLTGKPKTVNRYKLVEVPADKLLQTYPTAIEQAISIEPDEVRFMGNARPPVANAQMRNSFVENSPAALKAVEAEGNTPFFLNLPLFEMYKAMGLDAVMQMFGEEADVAVTNVNHLKTLEGRNLNLASSFKSIEGLVGDLENQAEKAGVPAQDFAVRYAYNMSKVNRLQQLGRFGPQASKFVRELLLPTRSTIDVSKVGTKEHKAFGLALAQALGVKVHTISVEASNELVFKKLENEYSGAVESLAAWLNDYDPATESRALTQDEMASIKERLGKDFTPVAVHALMEYARYKAMDKAGKKEFTTSLYVEADGVTNGPINAMMLMTTGKFTPEWINNIRKGGLFLGLGDMTMNAFRGMREHGGHVDLYQTAAVNFKASLASLRNSLKPQPAIQSKMNSVLSLMATFLPDQVTQDAQGDLDINRSLVKNPLTVTIYGAGAKGVSSKITQALLDAVYARMTEASKKMAGTKMSWGEAMFGAGGEKKFDRFVNDMNSLTQEVVKEFEGKMYVKKTPTADNRSANNPKDFTLQSDEITNLSENLLKLFVTPLRQGITDTLGADLVAGAETIQQATQVQSIFMANAYLDILEKIKATKPKSEFLSKADLKTAMGQLKAMHPLVQTEEQSYFIAGREAADDDKSNLAASLKERFKMPASVYGPRDAGVKGIPFLVIGMGDGVMMQRLATMMGAPEGTLKVFDGMNMKLSTITEDSEKSNEAVTDSWKGNPFKAVSESFDGMLLNGDLTITDAMLKDFQRIFQNPDMNADDALARVKSMGASLKGAAVRADVRKQVLAEYSISVDQMASAAAPFKTSGKKQLASANLDEIAAELNEAYDAKLAAMDSLNSSDEISAELGKAGKKSKDGTRTLVLSTLKTLQKEFNIPDNMAVVLEQVLSSLAPKGYKVIYGTPDQLAAFATNPQDIADVKSGVTSGWTSTIDKVVYLAKPSAETLVHELVHASTIETLVDHYNGKIQGDEAAVVALAVSNMEKLMAQFLNSEERLTAVGSPELIAAYKNARQAILGFSGNTTMAPTVAKAAALNEFMAWALTNQNLATVLKTEKANPLARMAEQTIALIKKLIFGRKVVTAAGQDVFSNLLFNSSVIMAVQGKNLSTAGTAVPNSQIILKQASPNDDARLSRVQDAFDNMVVTYLNTAPSTVDADQVLAAAIARATDLALDAQANGFGMTLQESTTLQSVVAALATQAKIDPISMAKAQELYTQVTKQLTIQDFMADPTSQDPNEYDAARKKYEWLLGQSMVKTDALGRSSLLSAFLGMAIVNDELRSVLSKMTPEKIGLNKNDSANNVLENIGMNAMENLSATLSGTKGAPSVQAAINALTENIMDLAERNENLVETTINNATGRVNQLNAKIVEGMNALSEYALTKTEKLVKNNPNSKAAKAVNAAAQLTSLLVNEENADAVARGVMSGVNRTNLVRPIRELLSDLVGRTSTNAVILDMIKKVRSVVQQDRQAYRENVPTVIAGKFTRPLLKTEWSAMFNGMGKTDLATLITGRTRADTIALITGTAARTAEIKRLEKVLTDASTFNGQKQIAKSKQLAEYMMTGKAGVNLLRNAFAIGNLWGEGGMASKVDVSNEIDQLVSLYALEKISPADMVELTALVSTEAEGVDFALAYLTGQREEESRKASVNPMAQANAYKGYIPSEQKAGVSLIVADDSQASELRLRGYIRTGDYVGSNLESGFASKGYYFSPVGGKGAFTQGLLQNVNQTAGGVDITTGLTVGGMTAGNTVDPLYLGKLLRRRTREVDSAAPLLPVFDETGAVVAFERSIDPAQLDKLEKDTHLAKMIGVWRGRQVEEVKGQEMNYLLVDNLKSMYDEDIKKGASNRTEYVDLFGKLDPVTADAMKLMSKEVRDYVKEVFGNEFMVRKDIINDAVGYRAASVRDLWSGVSHWDPKTAKIVQRLFISTMGVDAYKYLVNTEKVLQNYVKDAKVLIVMKSVIVPAGNLVSNMVQLLTNGVSLATLYRQMPRKTAEVNFYTKGRIRHVEAEAELLAAANDPLKAGKLRTEIKSIEDSYRRLSIWPLIDAGEFSAISDAGISREEILLSEGKLHAYMENAVSKLPEGLQTAGKYALVTKDTALFQAVQKATEYGDFLGKAVLYDHLLAKGKTQAEALAQISEEFVNYDRLPGRFRGALESNGLLWFYNFKIRSVKVAASMIRNHPLQVLMAGMIPTLPILGRVGTVEGDNLLTIMAEGRIGNSMGIGQGLSAPSLNPWWNLVN